MMAPELMTAEEAARLYLTSRAQELARQVCRLREIAEHHREDAGAIDAEADALRNELQGITVIDPEDAEQVERLYDAIEAAQEPVPYNAAPEALNESLASALREYANPPKLEEPQGLGAVVEDAEGADWHRTRVGRWIAEDGLRSRAAGWVHIDAVRVLSEGVTP